MAPFTHTVSFDPIKDFKPIAAVATSPFVITVAGSSPANTLADFISYVKARPGQLTFGSAGTASLTHVSSAAFLKNAGLDMIHVPYRGVEGRDAKHVEPLAADHTRRQPLIGRTKSLATR
jgi:tripartite-type tricarboxylate transporter receptor subunit TctC